MPNARKCPVCAIALTTTELYRQTVDRCLQCNGVYFDAGELESIIKLVRLAGEVKLDEEEIDTVGEQERERILRCPIDDEVMIKHEIAGVVIDICDKCRGIWLDDREITALKFAEQHVRANLNLYIRLGN
mgnify:CR=1 FL=1